MIKKDFKKGDIYVATSHRQWSHEGIASKAGSLFMGFPVYERDIDYEEAVETHLKYMNEHFPKMKITRETIEKIMDRNERYFLSSSGAVQSYTNHEKADLIDIMHLKGEKELSELEEMKRRIIKERNIEPDGDYFCRIWEL